MLILKRRQGQAIDVGEDVKIILQEIRGSHAKIAIVAPKQVRVTRSEIARSISEENKKAAEAGLKADVTSQITRVDNLLHKVGQTSE
ncbi:MAG TPA: carbon storage regulator [bacterium]|nr:carbon storage regulator [bacterium]